MIKVFLPSKPQWEPDELRFDDFTLVNFGGEKNYWYKTGSKQLGQALSKGAFIVSREKPQPAQVVNEPMKPVASYFKTKTPWKK